MSTIPASLQSQQQRRHQSHSVGRNSAFGSDDDEEQELVGQKRQTKSTSRTYLMVGVFIYTVVIFFLAVAIAQHMHSAEPAKCPALKESTTAAILIASTDLDLDSLLTYGASTSQLGRAHPVNRTNIDLIRSIVESGDLVSGFDNTLIVGVVNFGYLDFAMNWLCYMQRIGLTNFLLGTVDDQSEQELIKLGYGAHVISLAKLHADPKLTECGGSKTADYATDCFNRQARAKTQMVLTSLLAGYDTVLSDMDISLIHNPFLYMPLSHSWEMQLEPLDNEQPWCTGWFWNKANRVAIRLQTEALILMAQPGVSDDQTIYTDLLKAYEKQQPDALHRELFELNRELFPVGDLGHYASKQGILQHNNWLANANEKRDRMRKEMMYLWNQEKTNATSKLVCEECEVCTTMVPTVKPLRATFPGQLLSHNFTAYGGIRPEWKAEKVENL